MSLQVYGESDIGFSRRCNEDAIDWCQSNNGTRLVAVLADGIGGCKGGDIASQKAVDVCINALSPLIDKALGITELIEALNSSITEANRQIRITRESDSELSRMGTTLLIVWMQGDQAFVANIGDSRCYRLSGDTANLLTRDDTVAQAMVDDGSITEKEISRVPFRNVLTKALGTEPNVRAEIQQIFLNPNETLLLCSDGLTGAVNSENWPSILAQQKTVKQQVESLIDESINNKADDNVSVIMMTQQ